MTGIDIVDVICPSLPEDRKVIPTMNHERWFHIVNGTLFIPPERTLRGNFALIDRLIEALHNYEVCGGEEGIWDDSKIDGVCYTDPAECIQAIEFLMQQPVIAVDIETRDTGYDDNKMLLIGFAYDDYKCIVIDNWLPGVIAALQKLFSRLDITFIWHNGKFDTTRQKYLAGLCARIDEDTMLQHYAGINERKGTHGLKDLAPLYLQAPQWDEQLAMFKRKWCAQHKVKLSDFKYDMIPRDILLPYLYRDCCATFQLRKRFDGLMRPNSKWIYRQLVRAANVFKDIELQGCLVDEDYLYELQDELDTRIYNAEKHVREEAARTWDPYAYGCDTGAKTCPKEFSHKSPKQLKWMLERVTGKTLTSTDKEALDKLAEEFPDVPFIRAIMELRKYNKYMDTYVTGIQKVMQSDKRVRCTFNLHGTETGRLSCSEPNMQNIPRMKMIKNLFIAPEGYKLVQLDYSQAELRVLAYMSQDDYLIKTYQDGRDLHDAMAEKIFGPDFNKEQRVAAKTINFGIPYGRGPGSMAGKMGMSLQQATQTIRDWYKAAPGAKKYVDEMRRVPYREGEPFSTVFGRQRHYIITMDNRNHVENEAVNFPISSIASDLTMLSVCDIHDTLLKENLDARIVNTVHDSIIIECIDDPEILQRVVEIGTSTMAEMPKKYLINPVLNFPFKADAEIGRSWGDLENADEVLGQEDISE